MVWYGVVWYGMVWYCVVWYGVVWPVVSYLDVAWFGMVGYAMVWCGMKWYMVWNGTVDGGNLAPLEHKQAYSTPRPLFNIVRECGVLRTWSNDVNLAPPHLATVQC